MYGMYRLYTEFYFVPTRLYQAWLHNNKEYIGEDMSKVKLPIMDITTNGIDWELTEQVEIQQIHPSSLLAHLGVRTLGQHINGYGHENPNVRGIFNAETLLGYYDIGKNYYSNRQEKVLWMINYGTHANQEKKVTFRYQFGQQRIFEPPAPRPPHEKIAEQEVWGSIAQIIIEGDNLIEEFDRPIIRTYSGPNYEGLNDRIFASNPIHRQMSKDGSRLIKMSIDITPIDNNFLNGRYYGGISLKNKPEQYRANIEEVPVTNMDDMREDILAAIKTDTAFKIDKNTYAPYGSNFQESTKIVYKKSEPEVAIERNCITSYYPMQGMYLCTYMSNKFNNWLDSEYIDKLSGVGGKGLLDVTEGLNLNVLQLAMKIYDQTNRIALSNRSYEDWMLVVHGQHNLLS